MGSRAIDPVPALDLPAFHQRFRVPDFMRSGPGHFVEWLWHYDLGVAARDLWPYVTDTSRMNRAIGYPEMDFREHEGQLYGASSWEGVRHEWLEIPWDFSFPYTMVCVRRYRRGIVNHYHAIYFAEDYFDEGACRVYIYLAWVLRMKRTIPGFTAYFQAKQADYGRVLHELDQNILAGREEVHVPVSTETHLPPVLLARVQRIRLKIQDDARSREIRVQLVDRWIDHLLSADELDLYRIQIVPLAGSGSGPAQGRADRG